MSLNMFVFPVCTRPFLRCHVQLELRQDMMSDVLTNFMRLLYIQTRC